MCVSTFDILLMILLIVGGPSFLFMGTMVKVTTWLPKRQYVTVDEWMRWRNRNLIAYIILGIGTAWSLGVFGIFGGPALPMGFF